MKRSFKTPKTPSVKKDGKIKGHKGGGGFAGTVKQGGPTSPVKKKTNP